MEDRQGASIKKIRRLEPLNQSPSPTPSTKSGNFSGVILSLPLTKRRRARVRLRRQEVRGAIEKAQVGVAEMSLEPLSVP